MRYCVAFISFHNNELVQEIIEANSWKEALQKHSMIDYDIKVSDDMETAKVEFFDGDAVFSVIELPDTSLCDRTPHPPISA